jgi:small subunit ribosomal protein S6
MAKSKKVEAPHYELLYIISNKYSEDELKPIIQKVGKIIKDNRGNITKAEEWGKKRLAYPIKHFNYGYYNLVEFDIEGGKIEKINRTLRMTREILRHQMVVKKVKTPTEIKKEKEISEKIATKAKEKEKLEEEKIKGKVDLKDLDKKLDKILDTDDLL